MVLSVCPLRVDKNLAAEATQRIQMQTDTQQTITVKRAGMENRLGNKQ